MNKFEIVIQTAQGFLSYVVVRVYQHPKELWQHYREEGGVEAVQGGWIVWYPYQNINTIRFIGTADEVERPSKAAIPQDYPRPYGILVASTGGLESVEMQDLRKRLKQEIERRMNMECQLTKAQMSIQNMGNKDSQDTERLNRIIRWGINTANGDRLLEFVDGTDLRLLHGDVYASFRQKIDKLL